MKKTFLISLFLFCLIMMTLPFVVSAAIKLEYPLPGLSNNTNPTPGDYIKALYIWGLGIVGAVAVASIAYGGIRYMVGDVKNGKDIITSALLGLLVLLGAWLILYTINPDLATFKEPANFNDVPAPSWSSPNNNPNPTPGSNYAADTDARNALTAATGCDPSSASCKISVNAQPPQTSLAGIKQGTISEVENLQAACNCNIRITAGTEAGHAGGGADAQSHANGYKVDLGMDNSTLNSYITTNYAFIGNRSGDNAPQYKAPDGTIYANEASASGGPHWDVLVPGQ